MLELVDRIRIRDELQVARQLQSDLLPSTCPELAGYSIVHSYRTANEIGVKAAVDRIFSPCPAQW